MSEEKEKFVMRPMYIFGSGLFTGWVMLRLMVASGYVFKWNSGGFMIDVAFALILLLYGITKKGE